MNRAWGWSGVVLAIALAGGTPPARAQESDETRGSFFSRVEVGGGSWRQECKSALMLESTRLEGWGGRLERRLTPTVTLGMTGSWVDRTGSVTPVLPNGASGSLYYLIDDRDMAYRIGLTWHPNEHLPLVTGAARLGRADELYLSAHLLEDLPHFSSDDLDVGLGLRVAEPLDVWIGAASPLNRDVVGGKVALKVRPLRFLEIGVTGRAGRTEFGRLHGVSASLAWIDPKPWLEATRVRQRSWIVPPPPGRLQYVGAGAIAGAVAGVLVGGIIDQQPCGHTGATAALVGIAVGGGLGSLFGQAMWQ